MSDQTEDQDQELQVDNDLAEGDATSVTDAAQPEQDAADVEKTEEDLAKEKMEKLKDAIDVSVEDMGTLRQRLTVTVPHAIIEERLDDQFAELQRERDVRGFRRGRAPRRLVEKAYGSEVRELIKEQVVGEAYLAATEKQDMKVLGDPDLDFDKIELPAEGDLEISCEVEIKPEFALPELKGIAVRKPTVTVTDDDVDLQIERLRMRFGHYEPAEGGEIQADDTVVADVKMTADDEVIHEEAGAQFAARPSRIEGIVVEKLGDALVGAKVDEERSVEAPVPEDHETEALRGKTARFNFKIREVRRMVLPALDDAFAQTVGCENVTELRTMVRAESESQIDHEVRQGMRAQIRQHLADNVELEIPAGLSSRQTDRVVQRQMVEMQRRGVPEAEIEKNLDQLQASAREVAANELKMFFVLEKLAEELEVDVSEEEINGQVAQIAQASGRRFDRVRDELMRRGALQSLYLSIRDEKCIDRLLQDAEVTEVSQEQAEEGQPKAKPKRKKKGGKAKKKDKAGDDLADET